MSKDKKLKKVSVDDLIISARNKAIIDLHSGKIQQKVKIQVIAPYDTQKEHEQKIWKLKGTSIPVGYINTYSKDILVEDPTGEYSKGSILLSNTELNSLLSRVYKAGLQRGFNECIQNKGKEIQVRSKLFSVEPEIIEDKKMVVLEEKDSRELRIETAIQDWNSLVRKASRFIKNNEFLGPISSSFCKIFHDLGSHLVRFIIDEVINKPLRTYIGGIAAGLMNSFMRFLGEAFCFDPPVYELEPVTA